MNNGHNLLGTKDYGGEPYTIDIINAAKNNPFFRTALWTGKYLQLTLMSIKPQSDIGLEQHCDTDQIIFIAEGCAHVKMGKTKDSFNYHKNVTSGYAIFIPAGTWHNVTNTGKVPLKIYSVYGPPNHPFGTVHKTKADAENSHHY